MKFSEALEYFIECKYEYEDCRNDCDSEKELDHVVANYENAKMALDSMFDLLRG